MIIWHLKVEFDAPTSSSTSEERLNTVKTPQAFCKHTRDSQQQNMSDKKDRKRDLEEDDDDGDSGDDVSRGEEEEEVMQVKQEEVFVTR